MFAQRWGKNKFFPISVNEYFSEFFKNWKFYLVYLRNKSNENKILRICFRDNYETDMAFVCNINKKCEDFIYKNFSNEGNSKLYEKNINKEIKHHTKLINKFEKDNYEKKILKIKLHKSIKRDNKYKNEEKLLDIDDIEKEIN
jgi:hypothetical protein